jgi:hypothetical protein
MLLLLLFQIMVLDKDRELRWKDYRGVIFSQFFRCALPRQCSRWDGSL